MFDKKKAINLISREQAIEVCERQEDDFFDLKSKRAKINVIEEIVVAFANSEGGEVAIGIEDKKTNPDDHYKRWSGYESIEHYNDIIHALSRLDPVVDFNYWYLSVEGSYGNYVLYIKVHTDHQVHQTAANEVFTRKNAGNIKVKNKALQALYFEKGVHSFEDQVLNSVNPEEVVDSDVLSNYINDLKLTNKDNLNFLIKERLISERDWFPIVASILLFSQSCSSILPQAALRVTRYESIDGDELRDIMQNEDSKLFEGNILEILQQSFEFIKSVLDKIYLWGLEGRKTPKYPDEAIWEILVNCLIHRDYSIQDSVHVKIFDNQISFESPGKLPGMIKVDNILDNRFSRNPKIVRLLSKSKQAPNKELGEGLNTATVKMSELGLRKPEFKEENNKFIACLYHVYDMEPEILIRKFKDIVPDGFTRLHARHLFGLNPDQTSNELQKLKEKKIINFDTEQRVWHCI